MRVRVTSLETTGRRRQGVRPGLGAALAAPLALAVVAAGSGATAAATLRLDAEPLGRAELATLRGGLFTHDGYEFRFGMRFELDIDDEFRVLTEIKPAVPERPKRSERPERPERGFGFDDGELEVTLTGKDSVPAGFTRKKGGKVVASGAASKEEPGAGHTRYTFKDGTVADVVESEEGFTLNTDGDHPVRIVQNKKTGLAIEVGDSETSLARNAITPEGISALLTNRRNGATLAQRAIVDIEVLNHTKMAAHRKARLAARRMQDLVNGGLIQGLRR